MLVLRLVRISARFVTAEREKRAKHNYENFARGGVICQEYATFAGKVRLRETTSATPTVKPEERLKRTFKKFPT